MKRFSAFVFVSILLSFGTGRAPADVVSSTFDTDSEGWGLFGDGRSLTWNASGGNPGGFINAVDIGSGDVWYFNAPAKFLGDQSSGLGQSLAFDLKQSGTGGPFDAPDVVLTGGGLTLVFDTPQNPASTWTSYVVPLSAALWRKDTLTGAVATQADLVTTLSNLTALHIRGEFISGNDSGSLDNVQLNVPEPGSACALAVLAAWTRRKR